MYQISSFSSLQKMLLNMPLYLASKRLAYKQWNQKNSVHLDRLSQGSNGKKFQNCFMSKSCSEEKNPEYAHGMPNKDFI